MTWSSLKAGPLFLPNEENIINGRTRGFPWLVWHLTYSPQLSLGDSRVALQLPGTLQVHRSVPWGPCPTSRPIFGRPWCLTMYTTVLEMLRLLSAWLIHTYCLLTVIGSTRKACVSTKNKNICMYCFTKLLAYYYTNTREFIYVFKLACVYMNILIECILLIEFVLICFRGFFLFLVFFFPILLMCFTSLIRLILSRYFWPSEGVHTLNMSVIHKCMNTCICNCSIESIFPVKSINLTSLIRIYTYVLP